MTRRGWAVVVGVVAACGDNAAPYLPPVLSAGPVTIAPATMTLTVGEHALDGFLELGVATDVDDLRYYDPRGDAAARPVVLAAREMDGDTLVLDGGTRLRLTACIAVRDCALLEIDASAHARAVQLRLALPHVPGEPAYGTGDAAVRANVAGTVRELQLRVDPQSESSLNETHVPVPLVLWPRRGLGLFVADDRPGALDVAAAAPDRVTATFTLPIRGTYRAYIYRAPTPLALVRTYAALTAMPAVPPRWAFAPQQWRNVWTSAAEVREDAAAMRSRRIPGSAMWIDNPWQTAYNTFVVDEQRLAAPAQLIADLRAQGFNVVFWSTPYVGTTSATALDHNEGAAKQFFVTDDAGVVIDFPWQDGPGALVDFTRPGATAWWRARIARVLGLGAAGFKLDFGEELVPEIGGTIVPMRLAAGDNASHHARYAEGYHDAYLGALTPGEGFVITRAGAWGEQRTNTCVWPGDLDSDFSVHGVDNGAGKANVGGLPSAIARGLALSVSGYPFYGSDIGGFRGFPTTEVLLRWAQYAAYGTIMQLGGGGKSHNPWDATLFTPGADAIYKRYAETHMLLNPLLWTLAQRAGRDGTPVTRPARFVEDCACDDAMFFLGDDLLVAPVIEAGATTRDVVLPPGAWLERETGAYVTGDGTAARSVPAPLDVIPTWQRRGSFIPMFARVADTLLPATAAGVTSYADRAFGRELRLHYAPPLPTSTGSLAVIALHDGTRAVGDGASVRLTGGDEYDVITVEIDARDAATLGAPFAAPTGVALGPLDLPAVDDVAACPEPGCWRFDALARRLEVRVFVATGVTRELAIR